jgi:DNA-binding MarR family transcriptional regulator
VAGPSQTDAPALDIVGELAEELLRLVRAFNRARQQFLAKAEYDVERSAHLLLRCLKVEGTMRAGALADRMGADPSTISRQVASLVRDGHVVRRADPIDGRASLLEITDAGLDILAGLDVERSRHFARMLEGWSETDLELLGRLLGRFTDDYTAYNFAGDDRNDSPGPDDRATRPERTN